jgi:enoyl-CoA hydratase/carnithine racemase
MHPPAVHLVLNSSELAALCLELKDRRMNRCLIVGSSGAEDFCLGALLSYSN